MGFDLKRAQTSEQCSIWLREFSLALGLRKALHNQPLLKGFMIGVRRLCFKHSKTFKEREDIYVIGNRPPLLENVHKKAPFCGGLCFQVFRPSDCICSTVVTIVQSKELRHLIA